MPLTRPKSNAIPMFGGALLTELRLRTAAMPPRRSKTACSGEVIASATKLNASARLLLPDPLRPTRNNGLSSTRVADGKLRKRLRAIRVTGLVYIEEPVNYAPSAGRIRSNRRPYPRIVPRDTLPTHMGTRPGYSSTTCASINAAAKLSMLSEGHLRVNSYARSCAWWSVKAIVSGVRTRSAEGWLPSWPDRARSAAGFGRIEPPLALGCGHGPARRAPRDRAALRADRPADGADPALLPHRGGERRRAARVHADRAGAVELTVRSSVSRVLAHERGPRVRPDPDRALAAALDQ